MVKSVQKTINLKELFEKQERLTRFFRQNNNIKRIDWDKTKGAIICELWEMANELKSEGFKEWTTKERTTETLEELTDVFFFYLQTGNDLDVVYEHHWIEKHKFIMNQILAINSSLLSVDGILTWTLSFAQYRGLVEMLGYEWAEVVDMYHLKYEENIARQKKGY